MPAALVVNLGLLGALSILIAELPMAASLLLLPSALILAGLAALRLLRPVERCIRIEPGAWRLCKRSGEELLVRHWDHCFVSSRYIGLAGRAVGSGRRLRRGWFRSNLGDDGFRQLAVSLRMRSGA